jgi:tripeptide aminopeptidase
VDSAQMHYIIRDFDRKAFEARKRKMMEIAKKVGKGCILTAILSSSSKTAITICARR